MGALRDMFKEEFEERDRKISDLSEQLENKDKQLQTEHEENIKLRKELDEIKKLLGNKIAML